MSDPYIYIDKNSLSAELCRDIIEIFEESPTHKAKTIGGVNEKILKARQCFSSDLEAHPRWPQISNFISNEAQKALTKYISIIDKKLYDSLGYQSFNKLIYKGFHINKYSRDVAGEYHYHTDRHTTVENHERCITFIWYLNDVAVGGETEFRGDFAVKPEVGKLILFPSTWTYPHSSKPVISNDKYIMVGWFLLDINQEKDNINKEKQKNIKG